MVFPVVMYGCESWNLKKAGHWRIDASELWCWIRLLRVRWTARRSNQSILKEIIPEYSLEGLMLKLKLQYFGHLIRRADSLKDPDAGKDWRQEEKGMTEDEMVGWHHWLNRQEFKPAPGDGEGQGSLACSSPWGHRESDTIPWTSEQQSENRRCWVKGCQRSDFAMLVIVGSEDDVEVGSVDDRICYVVMWQKSDMERSVYLEEKEVHSERLWLRYYKENLAVSLSITALWHPSFWLWSWLPFS